MADIHEEELQEFVIFEITKKDGTLAEMAVVDEFDFENRHYVVGALVEGDSIKPDGLYIYRANETEDEFVAEQITDETEFDAVAKAYAEMGEE